MDSREEKILAEKFALIYQFNKNSPLFSRVASRHLEDGELEQAVQILEEGIRRFPAYPTGIIIYALALAKVGEKDRAKEMMERLSEFNSLKDTVDYYMNEIESMTVSDASISIDTTITSASSCDEPVETITQKEEPDIVDDATEEEIDDLEELAEKLQNASIPKVTEARDILEEPDDRVEQFSGKSLVSETLAKIYFNQGNYQEALSIYETLIEIQPGKAEHYQKLIDHINAKMKK